MYPSNLVNPDGKTIPIMPNKIEPVTLDYSYTVSEQGSLYVNVGGTVKLCLQNNTDDEAVTLNFPNNFTFVGLVRKVFASGTSATGLYILRAV